MRFAVIAAVLLGMNNASPVVKIRTKLVPYYTTVAYFRTIEYNITHTVSTSISEATSTESEIELPMEISETEDFTLRGRSLYNQTFATAEPGVEMETGTSSEIASAFESLVEGSVAESTSDVEASTESTTDAATTSFINTDETVLFSTTGPIDMDIDEAWTVTSETTKSTSTEGLSDLTDVFSYSRLQELSFLEEPSVTEYRRESSTSLTDIAEDILETTLGETFSPATENEEQNYMTTTDNDSNTTDDLQRQIEVPEDTSESIKSLASITSTGNFQTGIPDEFISDFEDEGGQQVIVDGFDSFLTETDFATTMKDFTTDDVATTDLTTDMVDDTSTSEVDETITEYLEETVTYYIDETVTASMEVGTVTIGLVSSEATETSLIHSKDEIVSDVISFEEPVSEYGSVEFSTRDVIVEKAMSQTSEDPIVTLISSDVQVESHRSSDIIEEPTSIPLVSSIVTGFAAVSSLPSTELLVGSESMEIISVDSLSAYMTDALLVGNLLTLVDQFSDDILLETFSQVSSEDKVSSTIGDVATSGPILETLVVSLSIPSDAVTDQTSQAEVYTSTDGVIVVLCSKLYAAERERARTATISIISTETDVTPTETAVPSSETFEKETSTSSQVVQMTEVSTAIASETFTPTSSVLMSLVISSESENFETVDEFSSIASVLTPTTLVSRLSVTPVARVLSTADTVHSESESISMSEVVPKFSSTSITQTTQVSSTVCSSDVSHVETGVAFPGDDSDSVSSIGACGWTSDDEDNVAVGRDIFDQHGKGSDPSDHCGMKLIAHHGSRSVEVTVNDRLGGGAGACDLKLSPVAFSKLAPDARQDRINVTWEWA